MLLSGGYPLLVRRSRGIHYVFRSPAAPDGTQFEQDSQEELFDSELKEDAKQYIKGFDECGGLSPSLFTDEVPEELFFDNEVDRRVGEMAKIRAADPTVSKHSNHTRKMLHHLLPLYVPRLHSQWVEFICCRSTSRFAHDYRCTCMSVRL